MTVEAGGGGINSLNATYPASGDDIPEGDDHLRLIKTELKYEFPNFASGVPMTATQAELNTLDGITATTAELNILDGVTSTAAELNILDGVTATAAELNSLDASAQAVTGFTYSNIVYIDDDGDSQGGDTFDIDAVIGGAWESIGPTGSGATNIWTALDALPASTPWVEVTLWMAGSGSGLGRIYARKTGASSTNDISTIIGAIREAAGEATYGVFHVKIPLDSSNRFDLYNDDSMTSPNYSLALRAFGA